MRQKQRLDDAATKIQTGWRGFWGYSHFIIMQYEITRLQAIVRGRASRILFSLQLGCCIMIQSAVRRCLARKTALELKLGEVALRAQVEGMRKRLSSQRIQCWWKIVMECIREKKAALIIERFFLMVKAEVDKEIMRQRQFQTYQPAHGKQNRMHSSGNEDADDKLLERVWLNTVDEDYVDIFACNSQEMGTTARSVRSKSVPCHDQKQFYAPELTEGIKHHPSSPTMHLVMRHEYDPDMRRELELHARQEGALESNRRVQKGKPPPDVTLAKSDERTEFSEITPPTVFNKNCKDIGKRTSKQQQSRTKQKYEESLSGEGIFEPKQRQHRQSTPNTWSKHHFFDEEEGPKKQGTNKRASRRHHSTSSIGSGSDASDLPSPFYSRSNTATTVTRTTVETMESGVSLTSEFGTDANTRKIGPERTLSAASKGKKVLEKVTMASSSKKSGSPRHGRIVVTNRSDYPILSQDSRDNVEVEYAGEQFGMI